MPKTILIFWDNKTLAKLCKYHSNNSNVSKSPISDTYMNLLTESSRVNSVSTVHPQDEFRVHCTLENSALEAHFFVPFLLPILATDDNLMF